MNPTKILIFLLLQNIYAITGLELAKLINDKENPVDMKSNLTMTLTNKKGKERLFKIRSFSKNNNKKQILWFLAPADEKGIAFLKIEHENKDNEMKLWLPDFKKIRRISPRKQSDSFMGSDMSYEDMTNRDINKYNYLILGEGTINGEECFILESKPNGIKSEYSKHESWITKNTFLPIHEKSYDRYGKILKNKNIIYENIKNYYVMKEIKVENFQIKHKTTLKFENIVINSNIENNFFHEKNLKRLPK